MKHLLAQVSGAVAASQLFVGKAFAALSDPNPIPGLSSDVDIKNAIVTVITYVLDFILIIAVLFVIIAGIRLIVSGGDEGEKDKAKTTIIYVIAGIVIILLARVIVMFVNNIF
ncbi:MAG: TrbC/VirB2 family protein [Candidatus Peribacteraceae bacterium]|nr:TrbC/VirB2 family protein [Candidatus Peribacteraceae bacterium]